jgi:2-amino-4-hydroxy-6-hydroxymethyldihydropteridine diphosphokinase
LDYKHKAYIGVGSNVGDRAENCRKALAAVAESESCLLEIQSPLYETEPVELEDQDWFINGVARIRTGLEPEDLLAELQAIERAIGREPGGPKFGPRILDLDILFFDDQVLRTTQLQLPHPQLHKRRFVLQPLCDIASELVHPVLRQTIRSVLSSLKDDKKKVILFE